MENKAATAVLVAVYGRMKQRAVGCSRERANKLLALFA